MSTLFGLFRMQVETDEDGCITSKYTEDDYVKIAFRGNNSGINWVYPFEKIFHHLNDSTPVYPLDNSPQGIYTVGDIKQQINPVAL